MRRGPTVPAGARPNGGSAPYASALDRMVSTIERRATQHRNHVIAVVLVTIAALVVAATARSWPTLAALLLLVPVSGGFFVQDLAAVDRWRAAVLGAWARGELDLAAFRTAVCAHPGLPPETLTAMLATLPSAGELAAEQRIRPPTRAAAAVVIEASQRGRALALRLNVAASAIVVVSVLAALWLRSWFPLGALALLVLRPALVGWIGRRRSAAVAREVAACRADADFSGADYDRLLRAQP